LSPRSARVASRLSGLELGFALWGVSLCLLLAGCGTSTVRRAADRGAGELSGGAAQVRWRAVVHHHELFEPTAGECATGVVVEDKIIVGTRGRQVVALSTEDGRRHWLVEVSGQVDGEAVYDPDRNQVLVGTDDGALTALDPASGAVRWRFVGQGSLYRRPQVDGARIYFATSTDKIYALSAADGTYIWEYDREPPEGFTIHGYGAPSVVDGLVFAGFSDGMLVALSASDGVVQWARSLVAATQTFVDVDTQPQIDGERVLATSYGGGLYALERSSGSVQWRVPFEGASSATLQGDRLFFISPRGGVHAADPATGNILWQVNLPDAGELSIPRPTSDLLAVSGSRTGLYLIDPETGRIAQRFFPGRGICAAPAVADGSLYILSNGGSLYRLDIAR